MGCGLYCRASISALRRSNTLREFANALAFTARQDERRIAIEQRAGDIVIGICFRSLAARFNDDSPRTYPMELWTPCFERLARPSPAREGLKVVNTGLGHRTLRTDPGPRRQGRQFGRQSVEHALHESVRQRSGLFLRADQPIGQQQSKTMHEGPACQNRAGNFPLSASLASAFSTEPIYRRYRLARDRPAHPRHSVHHSGLMPTASTRSADVFAVAAMTAAKFFTEPPFASAPNFFKLA